MTASLKKTEPSLYDTDLYAWAQEQAARLRAHASCAIDWENVAEEIESVGSSECSEIENRLAVLLPHLLKWQFQPGKRSGSWRSSIREQRFRLSRRLRRSPSLQHYPSEVLAEEFELARLKAADETGLPLGAFPAECPYTISDILDPDFHPGGNE
jgi:hypothetical protein